jgi:hypothetical protein
MPLFARLEIIWFVVTQRSRFPPNANDPTDVIEFGRNMFNKAVQLLNAPSPIVVTDAGILHDDSAVQPLNAAFPIVVTDAGIWNDVNAVHPRNVPASIVARDELASMVTVDREEHPWNAFGLTSVTDAGI